MKTRKREEKRFGGLKERVYLGRVKTLADLLRLDTKWKTDAMFILRTYSQYMIKRWRGKRRTESYMKTMKLINYCLKRSRGKKRHRSK